MKNNAYLWFPEIEKGIPVERIIFKGYGETKPIGDNATDEGRARNRRTEFAIAQE